VEKSLEKHNIKMHLVSVLVTLSLYHSLTLLLVIIRSVLRLTALVI
jgi:hypothetical protein